MTVENHAQVPGFNPNPNNYQFHRPPSHEYFGRIRKTMQEHKIATRAIGVILSGGMLVTGIEMCSAENEARYSTTITDDQEDTGPGFVTPDRSGVHDSRLSIDQLANIAKAKPVAEQMNVGGRLLNASVAEGTAALNNTLDANGWEGYNFFNRPVVKPSPNNTPQEIQDQSSLAYFQAWQAAQEGDYPKAVQLAAAAAEGEAFDNLIDALSNPAPMFAIAVARSATVRPVTTNGVYDGIAANGRPMISYVKEDLTSTKRGQIVLRFTEGTEPNSARWRVAKITRLPDNIR